MSKRKNHRRPGQQPSSLQQTLNGLLLASALIVVPSAMAEGSGDNTSPRHYHISSGTLSHALSQFAGSAGIQLSADARLTDGKSSPGLQGEYTVEEGLQKLLAGSGLVHAFTAGNTVTLKVAEKQSQASPATLPVMTVTGKYDETYDAMPYQVETSTAGSKFPIEITKVPQSVQVITEKAFEDQGALSFGDIMKQVPSANVFGSRFTGGFPSIAIRGFRAEQTRNGVRQLYFSDTDFSSLSHVQNVEVLKGPGGSLFGQAAAFEGAPGGIINVVTKRPYDRLGAEVSFTRGGWSGFDGDITTGQWDFNAPLTPDGALKMRFTGAVEGSDTFTDFQELNRQNFGLMLTYDDGGPVRAFINAEYQRVENLPNPAFPALGTVQSSGVGRISRDTFLGEPKFDEAVTESPLVQAWVEFDVLDNWNDILKDWKVTPRYQYHEFRVRMDQTLSANSEASDDPVTGAIVVQRSGRYDFNETDKVHIGQVDITGKLYTGPLEHQIYLNGDFQKTNSQISWFDRINVPDINALNPTFLNTAPEVDPNPIAFGSEATLWSGGFQDVISITKYFDLLGGFRYTSIQSDTDVTNSTYQIGGTFHVTDSIHLFSGFGKGFGFQPGAITVTGQPFDAEESGQVEAGIKVNFPWGLTGTASFFELTRTNIGTPDLQNPGFAVQTGEIRHRGAEVDLSYQVTDQWYVQGGYAFIDSKITKSNAGDQGNRFQNTPEHQANIWTHYRFDSGALRNLTLSTGVNFVGDRPLDNTNAVELPNFTTWDLGASYTFDKVRPFKDVKLELFANNVLDKSYFVAADRFIGAAVVPGDPRSIVGRISLKY
ncbi:TonB-dependent siderophore receptor [Methylicorpusculum sp.]|uniref:TonB-dependent siderophore receptor n=1 Tax=Methylicorpusculum sp. TaxID=2713644 RepID=UPI0027308B95|nr:TonB-dependent receptor [Methylicorpusculum sp.]MDP2180215.1 TonB-dependent receptor [Methylicorpusculum sp.]MDP3528223.1 TonB-dependent receptor [Methylicorpusculum sp.]MDZ4150509.1 TonB-dependent receptor [Methylicorpusculum sp.]